MSNFQDLVTRLRDYQRCHDGDVDEAADVIEQLMNNTIEYSLYWFDLHTRKNKYLCTFHSNRSFSAKDKVKYDGTDYIVSQVNAKIPSDKLCTSFDLICE
jgi:hypothetical protein